MITPASEMERRDRDARELAVPKESFTALAAFLTGRFDTARQSRESAGVDAALLDSELRVNSEYDPLKKSQIEAQKSVTLFVQLTETKLNHGIAWANEIEKAVSGKDFSMEATSEPEVGRDAVSEAYSQAEAFGVVQMLMGGPALDDEAVDELVNQTIERIKQEISRKADEAADRHKVYMRDQLEECGFDDVREDARIYAMAYGTGFLNGPVVERRPALSWDGGSVAVSDRYSETFSAPHPRDCYPSGEASHRNLRYMFELMWLSREEIEGMLGQQWYQDEEIRSLLVSHPNGVSGDLQYNDGERRRTELKEDRHFNRDGFYQCKEYWGPVQGAKLIEWGVDADPLKSYPMQIIFCDRHVLLVRPNPDPLGEIPYSVINFKRRAGSIWGKGLAHLMKSGQDITNGAWRALIDNMSFASGPMGSYDYKSVDPEQVKAIYARQFIGYDGAKASGRDPVKFHNIDSKSHEHLKVAEYGERMADNTTGIPSYAYGSDQGAGAARTASGLSMLLNAASRGLKDFISTCDRAKEQRLKALYRWNMLFSNDPSIKGDARVVINGTIGVLVAELQEARVKEFIQFVSGHPMGQKLLGIEGFNEFAKRWAEQISFDVSDILPSEQELKDQLQAEQERAMQQFAASQGAGGAVGAGPGGGELVEAAPVFSGGLQ
jgi:hypothetical protein